MRTLKFAGRTAKEILRDPLTLIFGLGFPIILLIMMTIIQKNVPVDIFNIQKLAPGMVVFGLSFMTLFTGSIIAKDRESAFLVRLYTTPMQAIDFMLGYTLPILVMSVAQGIICFLFALMLGLTPSVNILTAIVTIVPIAIFFIGMGMLFGSILNIKAVGGICGALVTNLTALTSGMYFDLNFMGKGFKTFAECLPFANAYELEVCVLNAEYTGALANFLWILGYGILAMVLAVVLFMRQMKKQ